MKYYRTNYTKTKTKYVLYTNILMKILKNCGLCGCSMSDFDGSAHQGFLFIWWAYTLGVNFTIYKNVCFCH